MAKGVTYKLTGVPEMGRTFQTLAEAVGKDGVGTHTDQWKGIFMRPATATANDAQSMAPYRTGKLRSAIFAAPGPSDKPGVIIGVDTKEAPYAPDVEFGTSRQSAQPFFRPAVTAQAAEYPQNIATDVAQLIEDVATKAAYHPPGT